MTAMTPRERFQAAMNFRPFDRLPLVEWAGWWDQTVDRWHREQLPAGLTDRYDICRHFGLDLYLQDWFGVRRPGCPTAAKHEAGIVADAADYERVRPHLYPDSVVDRQRWRQWAELQRQGEAVLWFTLEGFFWFPRTLLGIEPHLYAFFDQPELLHRINSDLVEWHRRVCEQLFEVCVPDFMTFAEDLSYNHGPMLSAAQFAEFLAPYYRQITPLLHEPGTLVIVDSDGDITQPLPWFLDAGVDGLLPLERQAGVDVGRLRQRHPRSRFIGCFDKMTMFRGEAAMRAEFERLLPTAASGGLIVSCDHQTPPQVSYDDYRLYLRLFREYADEAGRRSQAAARQAAGPPAAR